MPTRARLDEFIAAVVSGDHAGAIERVAARRVRGQRQQLTVDAERPDPQLVAPLDGVRERDRVRADDVGQVLAPPLRGERRDVAVGRRAELDRRVEELAAEAEAGCLRGRHR